jgi:hypothetical protein
VRRLGRCGAGPGLGPRRGSADGGYFRRAGGAARGAPGDGRRLRPGSRSSSRWMSGVRRLGRCGAGPGLGPLPDSGGGGYFRRCSSCRCQGFLSRMFSRCRRLQSRRICEGKARTEVTCCAAKPGFGRPARRFSMRIGRPVIAEKLSAVRRICPPPSPWAPSITSDAANLSIDASVAKPALAKRRVIRVSPTRVPPGRS